MKKLLKTIHGYLRRKLSELNPEFITVTVFVPSNVFRDLVDEYDGSNNRVSFEMGKWPNMTILNVASVPETE